MTQRNPFADFLESDDTGRRAAYFSRQGQFGGQPRSQRQQSFFQDSFSDLYNAYLGRLGQQASGGEMPTGQFTDYLGGLDFDEYYRQNVPYQTRNQGFSSFVPQVRWIV